MIFLFQKNFIKNTILVIQKARKHHTLNLEDCLGYAETGSGKTFAFLLAKFPYY